MSDVSQGPGWWLASDGKWYSPQQPPGPVPTNVIPEGRTLGGSAVPLSNPVSVPGAASIPPGDAPPSAPPGYGAPPTSGYGPPPGSSGYGAPPTSGYGPPPGAPGYGVPPSPAGYGYSAGYGYLPPQKTNGLAVASLVCSLLWMFGLGSVLALVFGSISLSQIKRSNQMQRGRGLAIAGVIVGVLGVLGMAAIILSVITIDHHCHQTGTCTFNTTGNSTP